MIAALLLQVCLLNAQTLRPAAAQLQLACENLSIQLSDFSQNCENAEACFNVQGGSPPYTVFINNQNGTVTTANPNYCFFHLQPFNDYVVTVTDAEGCTTSTELELPGASNFDAEVTHVTCNGGSDGRIEPIIPFDISPLYYRWEGPDGFESDNEVVEGLRAGTYYLILRTSENQCVGISHWVVTQPEPIQIEVDLNLEPCQLASACVFVDGGTAPYMVWAFEILPPGLAGSPSGQVVDFSDLNLEDGTPFNPSSANQSLCADGLPNGTYYIVVLDANNCYRWDDFGIQNTATFFRQREVKRVNCNGGSDGRICFGISGGIEPFSTTLSPPGMNVGITTRQGCFNDLAAGVYTLTTIDSTGCLLSENIIVREPDVLVAEFNRTNGNCDGGGADGCLTIEGGTPAYQVSLWQFPSPGPIGVPQVVFTGTQVSVDGGTRVDGFPFVPNSNAANVRCVQNIPPGIYYILVVDSKNCYTLVPLVVEEIDNPIEAHFEITSTSPCSGPVAGCLYVNGGEAPYNLTVWRWNSPLTVIPQVHFDDQGNPFIEGVEPTDDLELNPAPDASGVWCAQQIPSGFYVILVRDANGCYVLVPVTIPSSTGLHLSADVRNANCNGVVSRIKLTIEGGTAPYTIYRNSNSQPAVVQTNMYVVEGLEPGTYTFTVYDNFQCSATITVVIGTGGEIDVNLDFDPFGEEACVHPAGGTAPYVIRWYNLSNNTLFGDGACVHNLPPGAYTVVVTDAGGCQADAIFFIDENPCAGGEASVEPDVIESGETTTFFLHNWNGQSVQWQFKTELTGWLNVPGATTAIYHTPPMHSAVDRVIQVRAVVQCNGAVLISEPTHFTILGSNLLTPGDESVDSYLFDASYQAQLAALMMQRASTTVVARVFPTLSETNSYVRFMRNVTGTVQVTVMNSMGLVVSQKTLTNPIADQVTELSVAGLTQGAYFVRIEYGQGVQTERIIVNR
ncbi:MAG: T9SS type A sorting domain-containing protein [Saprospiraceae bacterium]|nr:T9SS type A sorting domain-containing protein [Saprospiraceae bacterium]